MKLRELTAFERNAGLIGILLLTISLYALRNETGRIASWFGVGTHGEGKIVAKIEAVKGVSRRRLVGSPEFQPIHANQSIFNRDTIMSDPQSTVLLLFQDGSLAMLGPEAMVEIDVAQNQTYEQDLILDVMKGDVKGSGVGIELKQNGKVMPMQPLSELEVQALLREIDEMPKPTPTPTPMPTSTPEKPAPTSAPFIPIVEYKPVKSTPAPVSRHARVFLLAPPAHAILKQKPGNKGFSVTFLFEVQPSDFTGTFELMNGEKVIFTAPVNGKKNGKYEIPVNVPHTGVYTWHVLTPKDEEDSEAREVTILKQGK